MNALGREIGEGEVVVVKKSVFDNPKSVTLEERLFVCESGFGMKSFTSGSAVMGHWKDGSGNDRIEGHMIDKKETEKYQNEIRASG